MARKLEWILPLFLRAPCKVRPVAAWKKEHKRGAGRFCRLSRPDRKNALMPIYDFPADPQSQAVTLISFGGEEGLEDLR
jgi:hypothetical protein